MKAKLAQKRSCRSLKVKISSGMPKEHQTGINLTGVIEVSDRRLLGVESTGKYAGAAGWERDCFFLLSRLKIFE